MSTSLYANCSILKEVLEINCFSSSQGRSCSEPAFKRAFFVAGVTEVEVDG